MTENFTSKPLKKMNETEKSFAPQFSIMLNSENRKKSYMGNVSCCPLAHIG